MISPDKHDVLVEDERGERLLAATFAHDEQGLRSLCRQLLRLKVELVAIERPDGLLVERLLLDLDDSIEAPSATRPARMRSSGPLPASRRKVPHGPAPTIANMPPLSGPLASACPQGSVDAADGDRAESRPTRVSLRVGLQQANRVGQHRVPHRIAPKPGS